MLHCVKVFENLFAKVVHYPEIDTIGHIWFAEPTQLLFGDIYQEQIQILLSFCDEYQPSQLLLDLKDGQFMIDSASRKWLQEVVYPKQKADGIKRKAYVLNHEEVDALALSLMLTAEEDPHQFFDFQYFSEAEEAVRWLSSFVKKE